MVVAYKRQPKYRRGHYNKVAPKVGQVTELYNQGFGIRQVMKETKLARATVRNIIAEQIPQYINPNQAKMQRARRQRERTMGNIILALKGLAASLKNKPDHTSEELSDRAITIFKKYMEINPRGTIFSLMGDKPFSVKDLIVKIHAVVLSQELRLDDRFEEIAPDTFKLKEYINATINN